MESHFKRIYSNTMIRMKSEIIIVSIIYFLAMLISIYIVNSDSAIGYHIQPYIYGSERVDLFFPVVITFMIVNYFYHLNKEDIYTYIHTRISKRNYEFIVVLSALTLVMASVFIVNLLSVFFSIIISDFSYSSYSPQLSGYLLSDLQMHNPIIFGLIWSLYKGAIGCLIALLVIAIASNVKNIFFVSIAPFILIFSENFLTSIIGIPQYSLTTNFVLNRLAPDLMTYTNQMIAITLFLIYILLVSFILRRIK